MHAPATQGPAHDWVTGIWHDPDEQEPAGCAVNVVGQAAALQVVPSGRVGLEQVPLLGLHVPAEWHASSGVQTMAAPAVHEPLWQLSGVQALLSRSHDVPLDLLTGAGQPLAGAHTPIVWH